MRFAKGVLAVVALLALCPGVVVARMDQGRHAAQPSAAQASAAPHAQSGISKDQAIEEAQRRYKARVVRAEVSEANGRRVYVLRLLSDEGRVWSVRIDAETGGEL
jgi:uncharacterized membrane protein YkoI